MFEKMRKVVYDYVVSHLDVTDNINFTLDDVYLIWTCKTLKNWKAVISTILPDGIRIMEKMVSYISMLIKSLKINALEIFLKRRIIT